MTMKRKLKKKTQWELNKKINYNQQNHLIR